MPIPTSHLMEKKFPEAEKLAQSLADEISRRLAKAVSDRGMATLAVSGGRSPIRLFQLLSEAEVPWLSVVVTLVDERWVDPNDDASNEKLVRENLLVGKAGAARFMSLKNLEPTPEKGVPICHDRLAKISFPFDVIVLGMGDDGHTASLFPHAPGLAQALNSTRDELCAAVRPTTAPHPRMTLTLRALQSSRWLVLPLQGDAKLKTFRTAMEDGPIEDMPVRAVLRQMVAPIEVWISK